LRGLTPVPLDVSPPRMCSASLFGEESNAGESRALALGTEPVDTAGTRMLCGEVGVVRSAGNEVE